MNDETLNQRLTRLGMTTKPSGLYKKHIYRDGVLLFTGNSFEVSSLLDLIENATAGKE